MHRRVHALFAYADALGIISVFTAAGFVAMLGTCRSLGCILATAVKNFDAVHERRHHRMGSVWDFVSTCFEKWLAVLESASSYVGPGLVIILP